jgi:ribosomal protein S18 acetylase RimI-like enzyme
MLAQTITESSISLRTALVSDVPSVEELVHIAYRGGKATVSWKNEDYLVKGPRIAAPQLHELVASNTDAILLAETKNDPPQLVGCVLIEKQGSDAHIGLLSVHPEFQNLGLGKLLVSAAEQHAQSLFKCAAAKMFVLSGRDELLKWYKRLGYEETGETTQFPGPETGLTAILSDAHFIVISKPL